MSAFTFKGIIADARQVLQMPPSGVYGPRTFAEILRRKAQTLITLALELEKLDEKAQQID